MTPTAERSGRARPGAFTIGQRVRIHRDVTCTAWGAPCNWGGAEGIILGGGGRVRGVRIFRVGTDESIHWGTSGVDFTEGMLEPVAPAVAQPDLFTESA
jgi:hypothetical protein